MSTEQKDHGSDMEKNVVCYMGLEWLTKHHPEATNVQMEMFIIDLTENVKSNPKKSVTGLCCDSWNWVKG